MEVMDVAEEGVEEDEWVCEVECSATETRAEEGIGEWLVERVLGVGAGWSGTRLRSSRGRPDTVSIVKLHIIR